ncbi:MAG: ADP-glyceromanno-heptose 6-epimerase [Flavobacteriales bacterium]|nr:ADP-glyceromanno-heptose 6-epimerase [Flavobacteriales bacterium]
MLIVTGAVGFIGSCLTCELLKVYDGIILAVDDFSNTDKNKNLPESERIKKVDRNEFIQSPQFVKEAEFVFHIGARTDTAEFDHQLLEKLNTHYTMKVWEYCSRFAVPMIYASSAATYGMGEKSFSDDHRLIHGLKPLNPYGLSKHEFDLWALEEEEKPPHWYGLKFFNVFGPNEYHKGRMASMVMHGTNQIVNTGKIRLFRSHLSEYKDGEQLRDFIYVKDVLKVILYLYKNLPESAIYNLGTGKAQTWNQLAEAIFNALEKPVNIEYIDIPEDIRNTYQYFTEAKMDKLRQAGFRDNFASLDESVKDYVSHYLIKKVHY